MLLLGSAPRTAGLVPHSSPIAVQADVFPPKLLRPRLSSPRLLRVHLLQLPLQCLQASSSRTSWFPRALSSPLEPEIRMTRSAIQTQPFTEESHLTSVKNFEISYFSCSFKYSSCILSIPFNVSSFCCNKSHLDSAASTLLWLALATSSCLRASFSSWERRMSSLCWAASAFAACSCCYYSSIF